MTLEQDYDKNDMEHISSEDFVYSEKEAKKRAREEKKRRKHYKFSDKSQSPLGIVSSGLALCSLVFVITAIVLSANAHGSGGLIVGIFGGLCFLFSLVGLACGLFAFRRTDVLLKFAWIGVVANGIIWLGIATLVVFGM